MSIECKMLHMIDFRDSLTERFIRYTEFNTMSDPHLVGEKRPTTDGQRFFQKELLRELEELGLETYYSDESVLSCRCIQRCERQ